jgi:hypothetical protein
MAWIREDKSLVVVLVVTHFWVPTKQNEKIQNIYIYIKKYSEEIKNNNNMS